MFAVIRTGGKQYRVHPGDKIVVEKLDGNAGDKVTLGDVLLAGDGGNFKSTDGLKVAAEIVAQAKGEKVTVFKKRRRHNYRRKKGHRQQHTILKILAIGDHKAEKKAAPKAESTPAAEAPAKSAAPAKASKSNGKPATVNATPTENPAPDNEAQANPPAQSTDAPPKATKSAAKDKPTAKTPSTKNAAPAKGAAKKAPKGK
ncbi:MAG TPA: 50S ribosomal protein L21 [Sphingomicrobium sp.]|nr:50S ribosomal protein L21 [Sphingomicrobium sp.]